MTDADDNHAEDARLSQLGVVRIRAENPGLLTLSGTNSWVVSRDPAYVIDPGPPLPGHLERIAEEARRRGGLGAIVLTHDHADHSGGVAALRSLIDAPVAAARGEVDVALSHGDELGPLEVVATPGHAPDHLALIFGTACFTGDAVLGEGSVFIAPDPGALTGYLQALEDLRGRDLDVLCPGHGPPVWDPADRLTGYIEHRLDRERRLVDGLDGGLRSVDELLDAAWDDVPPGLRPAAAVTLLAHLDRLDEQGRLPPGVERPSLEGLG